jgi:hypothetical protein
VTSLWGAVRQVAWYPAGLSSLFAIELFVGSGASPFAAMRGILAAVLVGVVLCILGRIVAGDRAIGGLVAMLAVLAPVALAQPIVSILLVALMIALVVIARLPAERRPKIRWGMIGTGASRIVVVAALAIGIQAIQLGTPSTLLRAWEREGPFRATPERGVPAAGAPDIVLLMLDGYARADVLRDVYDFDGSGFLDALRERGFAIAEQSRSNYPVTSLSLLSLLQMDHVSTIPAIDEGQRAGLAQGAILRRALNDAAGLQLLRAQGYEIVALGSGFEQVGLREADRFVDPGQLNEFEAQWIILSGLVRILQPVAPDLVADQWRQRIDGSFDAAAALLTEPHEGPRFLLLHVPSPHAPWVHRADGSLRSLRDVANVFQETEEAANMPFDELRTAFIEQTQYVDRRALELIDRMQAGATDRPMVAAVFSDHGPSAPMSTEGFEVRLRNLLSVWSSAGPIDIEDDMTLVNLLPTILDTTLDLDVAHVDDRLYRWMSSSDLRDLAPVEAGS